MKSEKNIYCAPKAEILIVNTCKDIIFASDDPWTGDY